MDFVHIPVMVDEILASLDCAPGKIVADCTLGGAGHARAILEKIIPGGLLVGMDQDPDAIETAAARLRPFESGVRLFQKNYIHLRQALSETGIRRTDGILLDLGLSWWQIVGSGRGFSFKKDEPLDMRMNPGAPKTAARFVNRLDERALARLFYEYGEEPLARRMARRIVSARKKKPIETSRELAGIVAAAAGKNSRKSRIHPATRVFMALRIAVNRELDVLEEFMGSFIDTLSPGGRICVLSYHSLEDRIVKRALKSLERGCVCPPDFPTCVCGKKPRVRLLSKKARRPSEKEVAANPMSRSAVMRAAEKLCE
ncbi:Ribosomal RNA small subunit methyltransferase H [Candidatus Desulfarcum epimagneticum]|uniref:Ribosomal RNA small subunit methyltransferase H n=1 Tax=uncultured Desulfobacteraceae bacterium TaxID=218296 RepID=A0A484HNX9_9BACT|nr:Ribosomal RNA small subunit methyltransferase H [uncultured Desulfobacteraceae bacterium]